METTCPMSHCVFSSSFRWLFLGTSTPWCSTTRMVFFFHFSVGRPIRTFFCFPSPPPLPLPTSLQVCMYFLFPLPKPSFSNSSITDLVLGYRIMRTCPGLHMSLLLQTQQVLHMAEMWVFILVLPTETSSAFTFYAGEEGKYRDLVKYSAFWSRSR